jgi:hypothetical protein
VGEERRRFRRLDIKIPARLRKKDEGVEKARPVLITNLGPSGLFVETPEPLALESTVCVDFDLDCYPTELNAEAKVLWQREAEPPGYGMMFVFIPIFEQSAIVDYIQRKYSEIRDVQNLFGL